MAIEMMSISHCYCSDYMTKPTQFGDEPLFVPRLFLTISGDRWGDKMGEKLQFSKLKIKNLQKWVQFLMLEIMRFTSYNCRYYALLCKKLLAHAESTFPRTIDNQLNISVL